MKKQRASSLLFRLLLLWRRIEAGAVNGPEMAFCVQKRGAALSSVSMLSGLMAGGRFMCLKFTERGLGFMHLGHIYKR